jgi:hypothetical protein
VTFPGILIHSTPDIVRARYDGTASGCLPSKSRADLLLRFYGSQFKLMWFDPQVFTSLPRIILLTLGKRFAGTFFVLG